MFHWYQLVLLNHPPHIAYILPMMSHAIQPMDANLIKNAQHSHAKTVSNSCRAMVLKLL